MTVEISIGNMCGPITVTIWGAIQNIIVIKSKLIKDGKNSCMLADFPIFNLYISIIPQKIINIKRITEKLFILNTHNYC